MNAKILPFPHHVPNAQPGQSPGELQYCADISYGLLGLHAAWRRGLILGNPDIDVHRTEALLAHCRARGVVARGSVTEAVLHLYAPDRHLPIPDQTPYLPALMEWLSGKPADNRPAKLL